MHDDETYVNELTPSGDWPRHLKLRLLGKPVNHTMNMALIQSDGDNERHAALMRM
jgi:hypothetical protein